MGRSDPVTGKCKVSGIIQDIPALNLTRPMQAPHADRILRFEGAKNVRDLGGLPTGDGRTIRRGKLFRADGLARLTPADVDLVAALGVKTIIDLRYDEERERAPDRFPAASPPTFLHRGFLPKTTLELFEAINRQGADAPTAFAIMCSNYARMPFEHAAEMRSVIHDLLVQGAAPHLIHCTSGKDRTGVAVALILLALGVPVAEVLDDYLLSNGEYQHIDVFGGAAREDAIAIVMAARPEYLQATLDAIAQRCGSFEAYAENFLNFRAAERQALAALLLE